MTWLRPGNRREGAHQLSYLLGIATVTPLNARTSHCGVGFISEGRSVRVGPGLKTSTVLARYLSSVD